MSATTEIGAAGERPNALRSIHIADLKPLLPHLAAVCLLAALLTVFFWRLSFEQRVLSPADWIYTGHPWSADAPQGFVAPQNANQGDDAFLYYPRRYSYFEQEGGSWWQDQYVAGARNSFSNDFIGIDFYPVSWVYHLLPFPVANGFFHAGILLVAGVSMYLLLWQLKLPWLARLYGGMLFMLNGHFIVWLGAWVLAAMLGLVPLMIFGFERFRDTRRPLYLLIPAVCLAIQLYIAYIPGWVVTAGVLGMYGVVRLAPMLWQRDFRRTATMLVGYASAGVLGLFLGAYSLFPSVASAISSTYQQDRDFGLQHAGLENAWTFLFPNYWGTESVAGGLYLAPWGAYPSIITYFGITAAPLAVIGLWAGRRTWTTWFCVGMLAFALSQIYGIPPLASLAHLPGLKQTAAFRWNFCVPFAVAILAPSGLSAILQNRLEKPERLRLAIAAGAVAAIGVVAVIVLAIVHHNSTTFRLITESQGLLPSFSQVDDQVRSGSTHFHRQLALLLVASAAVVAALLAPIKWGRLLAIGLVVLAFVDLWGWGSGYNATIERAHLYPESPGIEFLQNDHGLFRIAQVGSRLDPMPGYTANMFGLQTVNGYDHYRDQDYYDFLDPMHSAEDLDDFNGAGYVNFGSNRWPLDENLLTTLNVKYIVTPPTGLYYGLATQPRNDVALGVYGPNREGQSFAVIGGLNAIEFLLGTGGPDNIVPGKLIVHLKRDSTSPDLYTWSIDASTIVNDQWQVLHLPDNQTIEATGNMYVEIEAPEATPQQPLYAWAIRSGPPDGWQRFENGKPVEGSLTFRALHDPGDWVKPVYQGADLWIYQLNDALPRAWGVASSQVAGDHAAAIKRVADTNFDPAHEVVLEQGATNATQSSSPVDTTVESYSPGDINVRTNGEGWAVFSERYDGGWKATVDGKDTQILRADGIFMAVPVATGEHEVKLTFDPPEYVWGERITLATVVLLLLAGGGYVGYVVWRRRKPAP